MAGQSTSSLSSSSNTDTLSEGQSFDNPSGCQCNRSFYYGGYYSPYMPSMQYSYNPSYVYPLSHPSQGSTCSCCLGEWSITGRFKYLSNMKFESSAMYPGRGLLQTPFSVQDLRRKARMCVHSISNRQ